MVAKPARRNPRYAAHYATAFELTWPFVYLVQVGVDGIGADELLLGD